MASPSKIISILRRKWYKAVVSCYTRDMHGQRQGPYYGIVRGIATNQAAVEDEGGDFYEATGLLVDIPKLGRNVTYGEWPVGFEDVERLSV